MSKRVSVQSRSKQRNQSGLIFVTAITQGTGVIWTTGSLTTARVDVPASQPGLAQLAVNVMTS